MATKKKDKKRILKNRTAKEKLEQMKEDKEKRRVVRMKNQPEAHKNHKAMKAKNKEANATPYELYEEQPIPWTRPTAKEIIFPFIYMEKGQSFEFYRESHLGQNVYSATVSFCNEPSHFHKKFVVRKIDVEMRKGISWTKWGCWREEDLDPTELATKKEIFIQKRSKVIKARRELAKLKKSKKKGVSSF